MKHVTRLLFALLLAASLFFTLGKFTGDREALSSSPAVQSLSQPEKPALPGLTQAPAPPSIERISVTEASQAAGKPQASIDPNSLAGMVVLTDENGVDLHGLDGNMSLTLWTDKLGTHLECPVRDGAFILDVAGVSGVSVRDLVLGDRGAVLENPSHVFATDEGAITIRARWAIELLLAVVDRETGIHLTGVTLVGNRNWSSADLQFPKLRGNGAAHTALLENGASPLSLSPRTQEVASGTATYLVHSPGYAWQQIRLSISAGGEREVRLEPGGDLEIRLLGDLHETDAVLRLRVAEDESGAPFAEMGMLSQGAVTLNGLPAGIYSASVEHGQWFKSPFSYGTIQVEVRPGESLAYELDLSPPPIVQLVPLAGTLAIPDAWKLSAFSLRAKAWPSLPDGNEGTHSLPQTSMRKVKGDGDAWAFDFGKIAAGTYTLTLSGSDRPRMLAYATQVDLTAGGDTDFLFKVPPPAQIILHVIDSDTGHPAKLNSIHWSSKSTTQPYSTSFITQSLEKDKTQYEWRAPIGEVKIGAFGGDYTSINKIVNVHAGVNNIELQIRRNCRLMFALFDGKTPVPLPKWRPSPEHLDGEGTLLFYSSTKGISSFALSDEGRYVFELPPIPGFELVPKQTIMLQRGTLVRHRISLTRLK